MTRAIEINKTAYPVIDIGEKDYHHARGTFLTAHGLMDFMRSPLYYRMVRDGDISRGDSAAVGLGRLFHMMVLEPERYAEECVHDSAPINPKTGSPYGRDTKAYESAYQEIAAQGKIMVHPEDDAMIYEMDAGLRRCDIAWDMVKQSRHQTEVTLRATIQGVECQCRVDGITRDARMFDLKTCGTLDEFHWDARKYHYAIQDSFYRIVAMQAMKIEMPWIMVACEKEAPNGCRCFQFSNTRKVQADALVMDAIARFRQCQKENVWPEYNGTVDIID